MTVLIFKAIAIYAWYSFDTRNGYIYKELLKM